VTSTDEVEIQSGGLCPHRAAGDRVEGGDERLVGPAAVASAVVVVVRDGQRGGGRRQTSEQDEGAGDGSTTMIMYSRLGARSVQEVNVKEPREVSSPPPAHINIGEPVAR
jgi:hypothetical protein